MEISTKYNPQDVENKWYAYWLENKFFSSKPDANKEPYTIVIPPPNVTGILHMGHMLNNTIQDILIRRARMQGKNACWVPGTDHASIATEAKVVNMLKERGIKKTDISRQEFLQYAFEWKEKYGGIILDQLKKLGCSCDWDRTRFTMEESLSEAVVDSFIQLYEKGYIYRGVRMVNWDPVGKTALSDEEVIFKENNSKLVFLKYQIADTNDFITIATVRPETIMGDVAVAVNPDDERYKHLIGKQVIVPLINRKVPVIAEIGVEIGFGTGTLKVTPAHDLFDYEIGQKHHLEVIDTLNDDGTLSEKCGIPEYIGKDRFEVRKLIIKDLEKLGLIEKIEEYKNQIGTSERTGAVIEPKLSMQWWLKMEEIAKPAYENVMNDTIRFFPAKFKNMYRSWMENPKDWCISRQLWWGQQIPAYYLPTGEMVIAKTTQEALQKAQNINSALKLEDLRQDEDVLDTWFSSWLWPISVFDGFKDAENEDFKYYYPTTVLVTGFDIIFFWVARMIVAGYEFTGKFPFKDVYFTGLIRDRENKKMSKSLGNSPDALGLINLYSADGVRFGVLFNSMAGNDLMFDTPIPPRKATQTEIDLFNSNPENLKSGLCEQGRNFTNKIWNSFRLLKGFEITKEDTALNPDLELISTWFEAKFNTVLTEVEEHFEKYRIADALQSVYKLFWDDFCAWYLEMIKPEYQKPIHRKTYETTVDFFDKLLRLLHPFMPFITEEIWQNLHTRNAGKSVCISEYPEAGKLSPQALQQAEMAFEVITQIRNIRNAKNISPKENFDLYAIQSENQNIYKNWTTIIQKLGNISKFEFVNEKIEKAEQFLVKTDTFFVPLSLEIDLEQVKKDLEYQKGFKDSVLKELSNENFVKYAKPNVVEAARKKLADAELKIKALEEQLG
jgi:valyl-tRNA synthetase